MLHFKTDILSIGLAPGPSIVKAATNYVLLSKSFKNVSNETKMLQNIHVTNKFHLKARLIK